MKPFSIITYGLSIFYLQQINKTFYGKNNIKKNQLL
jgi:hypothetical protein